MTEKENLILENGTDISANIEDSTAAQTKNDFVTRIAIAAKKKRETRYLLRLLEKSNFYYCNFFPIISENNESINILITIVKTSQRNLTNKA